MNQRRLGPSSRRLRDENARRNELARQAELRALHPDWPADRVRVEARGATWTGPAPTVKRKRDRRNKYGRRGGPNRCGHDRRNFHRPRIAGNLPPFVYWAIEAFETTARQGRLPSQLMFRFHSRSERDETILAMVPVMLAWTMVRTTQIGRPSKQRPGEVEGYTVDYHVAKACGISESRIERGIATLKDWGWQHFSVGKHGRRLAAQPIDETETGERRGRAAIRKWAPDFWRDIGISRTALKAAQQKYLDDVARQAAGREWVAVAPIVEQLEAALWDPTSRPRPPP